jgi:hypothetical protein
VARFLGAVVCNHIKFAYMTSAPARADSSVPKIYLRMEASTGQSGQVMTSFDEVKSSDSTRRGHSWPHSTPDIFLHTLPDDVRPGSLQSRRFDRSNDVSHAMFRYVCVNLCFVSTHRAVLSNVWVGRTSQA